MFAVEIDFRDGISPPETILVRRSNAIIGSSELAHVVIEGAASSFCELRVIRGLGREFSCHPVRRPGQSNAAPPFLEGVYRGEAALKLGELQLTINALDVDLGLLANEFPDRAGIRILRASFVQPSPLFPAVAVLGARPIFVSFPSNQQLLIGRSRKCGLRLDSSDVSSEHARVGMTAGSYWIEDLGSTNGTFVGEERVTGRRNLEAREKVRIGAEFRIVLVATPSDVGMLHTQSEEFPDTVSAKSYPCVVGSNNVVRPMYFPLKPGARVSIGRDPANDIWISAPHISRNHVHLFWPGDGPVQVTDASSNGTFLSLERLPRDVAVELPDGLSILDLSSGIKLGLCSSEEDEKIFLETEIGLDRTQDRTGGAPAETQESGSAFDKTQVGISGPSMEEVRSILEKAAGIAEAYPSKSADEEADAFRRLVRRRANQEQKPATSASDYGALPSRIEPLGPTASSLPRANGGVALSQNEPLQELSRGPTEGELEEQVPEEPDVVSEPEADYNLLSHAEFDEELLVGSQLQGFGRLMSLILISAVILIILFLLISIFQGTFV